ncbi:hypothetical protein FO519_002240 [Halicephalobus sp. NKZ332]|nr:hypothetical protein FO519_002240 [Halicephalobus sp. NKZ332]
MGMVDSEVQLAPSKLAQKQEKQEKSADQGHQKQKKKTNFWGEARTVLLYREPNETFGISIVGGRVEVSQKGGLPGTGNTVTGIFIKSVLPESPAGRSGKMFMGDRVISVNDVDLKDATHEYAVQVIKAASNPVKFVVQSLQSFSAHQSTKNDPSRQKIEIVHHQIEKKDEVKKDEKEVKEIKENKNMKEEVRKEPKEESRNIKEEEKHVRMKEDTEKITEEEHKAVTPQASTSSSKESIKKRRLSRLRESMRKKLDPESAAALKRNSEDQEEEDRFCYTQEKIKKKYGALHGEPILIRLENIPPKGLGLSLAGNKDREKNSVFVVDIKSTSPLPLKVGDELLEIEDKISSSTPEPKNPEMPTAPVPSTNIPCPNVPDGAANRKKSTTQMERTGPIETGKETWIEIDKDGKGLGLSIVGGSDTVLGTVVVHEVYNDGAAAVDGRLKPGDQLLEVNGSSLREVSHEQAISILRRTPPKVKLLVYRDVNLQMSLLDPTQIYNIFSIDLQKKPGRGLGLSIVGRKNEPGVYVSEIVKGGVAEQDGRLMQGDQILAVNNQDVTNSMQEDVATMLKTCTGRVALKIGRWKLTETANRVHAAAPPSMSPQLPRNNNNSSTSNIASNNEGGPTPTTPRTVEFKENGLKEERPDVPPPAPSGWPQGMPEVTIQDENQVVVHPDLSPVTEEPGSQNDLKSLGDLMEPPSTPLPMKDIKINMDLHEDGSDDVLISLKKVDGQQWGMGIGKRARGILITSLQPGSTAAEKLKVGDRIMAVNGEKITDQHSAVTLVKASGNCVVLQVARPVNRPTSGNL